jgi:hypothetical protein
MTSPETLELEAVEAALAGRYVAPEHAELAELALLLRDDRPEPDPAWQNQLDRRVRAGFPARPKQRRKQWVWLRQAAPVVAVFAAVAVIAVPIALIGVEGGGDDDSGASTGGGGTSEIAAQDSGGGEARHRSARSPTAPPSARSSARST